MWIHQGYIDGGWSRCDLRACLYDLALELPLDVRPVQRLGHHGVELLVRHGPDAHGEGTLRAGEGSKGGMPMVNEAP